MNRLLSLLAIICVSSGASLANAQALEVTTKIKSSSPSQETLVVGETFELIDDVAHPPGAVALIPEVLPLPDALAERTEERKHLRLSLIHI